MTGRELLAALQALEFGMDYSVLIGIEERWVQLEAITLDHNMKTIDLEGGK